ncbi:MAG: ion channel, partial [Actinomycetes bacterium]
VRLGRHDSVSHNPLSRALGGWGVVIVGTTMLAWIVLAFLGWCLVFVSSPDAVVTSEAHLGAGVAARLYYVGYSMTTLGNGAYRPGSTPYEAATVAATFTGMLLITLAISYLASLIGAVVAKRSFAAQVLALGDNAVDAVAALTSSGGAGTTVTMLGSLSGALSTLSQQHRAYPLLHAFQPREREFSTNAAVLLLLDVGVLTSCLRDSAARTPLALLRSTRSSAQGFLQAAPSSGARREVATAGPPTTQELESAGLDVDRALLERRWHDLREVRQRLLVRLADEGFEPPSTSRGDARRHESAASQGLR